MGYTKLWNSYKDFNSVLDISYSFYVHNWWDNNISINPMTVRNELAAGLGTDSITITWRLKPIYSQNWSFSFFIFYYKNVFSNGGNFAEIVIYNSKTHITF